MNITTKLFFILSVLLLNVVHAQKVDSTTYQGEKVYVYPFKVAFNTHASYRSAVNVNSLVEFSFNNYKKEIKDELGEEVDLKALKKLMKNVNKKYSDEKSYKSGKLKKAIKKNPYPLIQPYYSFSQDIIPSLDPIPDGKYIQYFESYCLLDEKGNCTSSGDIVSGVFHIKNGMLEGEAVWYNLQGDTLKYGVFRNGVKEGKWYLESRRAHNYNLDRDDIEQYITAGYPLMDTMVEIAEYKNGAKSGRYLYYYDSKFPVAEGQYKDGEEVGTWITRKTNGPRNYGWEYIWNNEQITSRYTINEHPDSNFAVKKIWIRNGLVNHYDYGYPDFDFIAEYEIPEPPSDLFQPNFKKNEALDLENEEINSYDDSYEDMHYYEEGYYDDYGMYNYHQPRYYDSGLDEYRNRGVISDSVGLIPGYLGVYEIRYPNGQLYGTWNFDDTNPLIDDTLFWDNGVPHDIIVFVEDSNHYERSLFDYKGKLYERLVYDSLGDFSRVDFEYDDSEYIEIDGYKVVVPEYGNYSYECYDTLEQVLTTPTLLYSTWSEMDQAKIYNETYDPDSRTLYTTSFSMTGNKKSSETQIFSEDFNSWTGKDTLFAGPLMHVSTRSASIFEGWENDSLPQTNVGLVYERYKVTSDQEIFKDRQLYTGPVEINLDKSRFSIANKDLVINLPEHSKNTFKKRYNKIAKYVFKGKNWDPLLQSYLSSDQADLNIGSQFMTNFFGPSLGYVFEDYNYMYEYDLYGYENEGNLGTMTRLTGYMHEGRPVGEWVSYDKKGRIKVIAHYVDGILDGKLQRYNYQYPRIEDDYDYYMMESEFEDSFPAKATYYLSEESNYRNGMREGLHTEYNWLGEVVNQSEFKEDYKNGLSIERNNLAYSRANFRDGMLDGYLQTYLTPNEEDTILLYDINFQNGLLQGESKAYHLNGKLAKRGFFLNGEPIEDYEAYDSLGFKYHYVKFLYSYPVEEKIWEENELSVKYNFDWRDSIYFEPSDITSSQSLESMLYDLGFGGEYLEQPYYGRPSLVNKSGIEYEMTKYYPNDQVARHGFITNGKKTNCWMYYNYDGDFLYEVDYYDTIIQFNDSIRFKVKGLLTDYDDQTGTPLYKAYIIEKFEKYDCSHSDHYEIRQLWVTEQLGDTVDRMNGYVRNYYDNGTLQSEGQMKEGLPTGFWKLYDPFGKLHQYGQYFLGKRQGRWLSGDLSKTKYLGDICLNPNLPDLEDELAYRENLLNVNITTYHLGKATSNQYYDINMNRFIDKDEDETDE